MMIDIRLTFERFRWMVEIGGWKLEVFRARQWRPQFVYRLRPAPTREPVNVIAGFVAFWIGVMWKRYT